MTYGQIRAVTCAESFQFGNGQSRVCLLIVVLARHVHVQPRAQQNQLLRQFHTLLGQVFRKSQCQSAACAVTHDYYVFHAEAVAHFLVNARHMQHGTFALVLRSTSVQRQHRTNACAPGKHLQKPPMENQRRIDIRATVKVQHALAALAYRVAGCTGNDPFFGANCQQYRTRQLVATGVLLTLDLHRFRRVEVFQAQIARRPY